ncbi:site-2 protease family protein [Poseidonocella sedimentorum]|uniref:Zinc metalloprotease n=1 Tax=Poseidonocella sedimentorum TaxID=871652 RepID=A0A1I6DVW4_9RHOB|nr:site-2 protease family protein [Poseidonocella sedimentorum]SFR09482.1 Zn-dependent protease (includes SpoIVFB) [Poseidonocella sedimentorum]
MFNLSQPILRVAGIEIRIAASWILIAALITWSLSTQVFPLRAPGLSPIDYLVMGGVGMVLFFVSLLLHEMAHALVARLYGIAVPRITLFLFGGVAELEDEPRHPREEFWIAIAGPAMSLALAGGFGLLSRLLAVLGGAGPVSAIAAYLGLINLVLALFNLLPAFPMDGGRILRAVLWARGGDLLKATERAAGSGVVFAYLLIGLGLLGLFQGIQIGGAWQVLIGVFILMAARSSIESARTKQLLGAETARTLMTPNAITASPHMTLSALVEEIMLPRRVSFVPVVEGAQLLGYIDSAVLNTIDRDNWDTTQINDVFVALENAATLAPGTGALEVLSRVARTGRRKFLVVEGRRLDGVLTLSDLTRFMALLSALDPPERESGTRA